MMRPAGSEGFVVLGRNACDNVGNDVHAAGDVDADGVDELLIGAREADPGGFEETGEVYLVYGRTSAP